MASKNHDVSSALWRILENLRGKLTPNDYQRYILPFMFYSMASFNVNKLMWDSLQNETDENGESIPYHVAWDMMDEDGEYVYRDDLIEIQYDKFGYVIEPKYLVAPILVECCSAGSLTYFIDYFEDAISAFEERCADNFKGTLKMINLYNDALGNETQANSTLSSLFKDVVIMCNNAWTENRDLLGDVYEELMGYFASNAGKKGGEFYTPQEMSELVVKLATFEVNNAASISDPTCGSGSLLIKAAKYMRDRGGIVGDLYGQELDSLTHRLAKMNMCLHNVNINNFHIDNVDTLASDDNSKDLKFDVTVANPPYALEWDNGSYRLDDPRFNGYGALAPRSNADLAFVQHIIHHMSDTGHAAVLLPLGVLFRGNAEQTIRQAMIDTYNIIDAIVVLPSNCFYGASIPVCCMVLRKDRGTKNDICFIDASNEFIKEGKKNKLTQEGIDKIYNAFTERKDIEHFCKIITREEIAKNDYNLNISLYVEAEKIIEEHDIEKLAKEFADLEAKSEYLKRSLNEQLPYFGYIGLFNVNNELADKHKPEIKEQDEEVEEPLDF